MLDDPAHCGHCHTPRLVVLGTVRKQAEQTSKEHPSMAFTSVPAFRFLPEIPALLPLMMEYGVEV